MQIYRMIILISLIVAVLSEIGVAISYYGPEILSGAGVRDGGLRTIGNTILVTIIDAVLITLVIVAGGPCTPLPMWTGATIASLSMVSFGTTFSDTYSIRRRGGSQTSFTLGLLSLTADAAIILTSLLSFIIPLVSK